jgi:uncharacterized membrane-anchored protein
MVTSFAPLTRRVPRILLFLLAGLIQVGLIAAMVFDRARVLREGSEVMLQTRPIDPRDFLRGDYVVLSYDISSVAAGALKDKPVPKKAASIYVKLAPKPDGFYQALSVHPEAVPIAGSEVLIGGRVTSGDNCGDARNLFCDKLQVKYGIERYFVPQGEGRELEKARNEGKVAVVVAVTPAGRAAIKRLLLDGKPVYDEPSF